ncbi:hypothetical protein [Micromonospora tulbaghiae]|uniref:hypothetical protein n=1 Tax=Micromonospora tulbaghiae TaxID=479978 RepID=UPI00343473E1
MTANRPPPQEGRRWGRYLAGVVGGLAAVGLAAATNIATNLPLPDWEWLKNPVVMWSSVVILAILMPTPLLRSRPSGGDNSDGGGEQRVVDRGDVQQVFINSPSAPVFAQIVHGPPVSREDLDQTDLPRRETRTEVSAVAGVRAGLVVTRFMSDSSGMQWEEIYNQVRIGATTAEITVQDARNAPCGARVEVLIVVHEARLVFMPQGPIHTTFRHARSALQEQPSMSIGIYLVGQECESAKQVVDQWIEFDSPMASIYIIGVDSAANLRGEMARLLQIVIDRDPRRSRPLGGLEGPGDLYDARMGDY